jgi:hypothetical protein
MAANLALTQLDQSGRIHVLVDQLVAATSVADDPRASSQPGDRPLRPTGAARVPGSTGRGPRYRGAAADAGDRPGPTESQPLALTN